MIAVRWRRNTAILVLFVLAVSACTGAGDTTTQPPATVGTIVPPSVVTSTTTTAAPTTEAPAAEPAPPAVPDLPQPTLPDPEELLSASLVDVDGFASTSSPQPDTLETLEVRLGRILLDIITDFVWDERESPDLGAALFVAAAPDLSLRGDPALGPFIASTLGGFEDSEPERLEIARKPAWRVSVDETDWITYVDNTTAFIVGGPQDAALAGIEGLIAASDPAPLWQPGECLFLGEASAASTPYAPFGSDVVVECDTAHSYEVIHSEVLPEGPDAPFPEDLQLRSATVCDTAFRDYVGLYDNESRLSMVRYLPDVDEWAEGDRYLACIVTMPDDLGLPTNRVGVLEAIGEESRISRTALECYLGSSSAPPVDCDDPHDIQFIGTVDVVESDYPIGGSALAALDALCSDVLAGLGGGGPGNVVIAATGQPPGPGQWTDGDRTVECFASVTDAFGGRALIVGGFDEGWVVVGEAEEPVTT